MTATTEESTAVTTQVHRVYIKATPEAIWDAITDPDWTEKYGYGGRVDFDLRPGGKVIGYTSPEMRATGAPEVALEGEVIEADPPRKLVQTWCLVMGPELKEEGFTRLTYDIEVIEGGATKLTVTHELEGAPKTAQLISGAWEHQGAGGGWPWILSDLKSLLETGSTLAG
jgi:uncharacterized protein YndB with AHSA1/START domain